MASFEELLAAKINTPQRAQTLLSRIAAARQSGEQLPPEIAQELDRTEAFLKNTWVNKKGGVFAQPRTPGDAISGIQERRVSPPPTRYGDDDKSRAWEPFGMDQNAKLVKGGVNLVRGLARFAGVPGSADEAREVMTPPERPTGVRHGLQQLPRLLPPNMQVQARAIDDQLMMMPDMLDKAIAAPPFSKDRLMNSLGVATLGIINPDLVESIGTPLVKTMRGQAPTRDDMMAANESGGAVMTGLAATSPTVRAGVRNTVNSARTRTQQAANRRRQRVYEETSPKEVTMTVARYMDDIEARLARKEKVGKYVLDEFPDGLPSDTAVLAMTTQRAHSAIIEALRSPQIASIVVPEESTVQTMLAPALKRQLVDMDTTVRDPVAFQFAKAGENLTLPQYRELVDIIQRGGVLDPSTGDIIPVKFNKDVVQTVNFIENLRDNLGAPTLNLSPEQLHALKQRVWENVREVEFRKDPLSGPETSLWHEQATGLRKLLEDMTRGEDGVSPITELDSRYGTFAALEKAIQRVGIEDQTTPRMSSATMASGGAASPAKYATMGGIVGSAGYYLGNFDPGLAALAVTGGAGLGLITSASINRLKRSMNNPRTGVRVGNFLRKLHGIKPPPSKLGTYPLNPPAFEIPREMTGNRTTSQPPPSGGQAGQGGQTGRGRGRGGRRPSSTHQQSGPRVTVDYIERQRGLPNDRLQITGQVDGTPGTPGTQGPIGPSPAGPSTPPRTPAPPPSSGGATGPSTTKQQGPRTLDDTSKRIMSLARNDRIPQLKREWEAARQTIESTGALSVNQIDWINDKIRRADAREARRIEERRLARERERGTTDAREAEIQAELARMRVEKKRKAEESRAHKAEQKRKRQEEREAKRAARERGPVAPPEQPTGTVRTLTPEQIEAARQRLNEALGAKGEAPVAPARPDAPAAAPPSQPKKKGKGKKNEKVDDGVSDTVLDEFAATDAELAALETAEFGAPTTAAPPAAPSSAPPTPTVPPDVIAAARKHDPQIAKRLEQGRATADDMRRLVSLIEGEAAEATNAASATPVRPTRPTAADTHSKSPTTDPRTEPRAQYTSPSGKFEMFDEFNGIRKQEIVYINGMSATVKKLFRGKGDTVMVQTDKGTFTADQVSTKLKK
jgi:hypothetical protein